LKRIHISCVACISSARLSQHLLTAGAAALPGLCGRAAFLMGLAIYEMAFEIEVIVDVGMDRGELL
jgi:hypothetical protein